MIRSLTFGILTLLLLEVILRYVAGFGEVPVYYTSENYEYALKPAQDVTRFHNRFYINAAGMRSDELEEGEFRILKFGDSILNGGTGCDQHELASEQLNIAMRNEFPEKNVRVLNISAGSWGVENAFLWMQQHGDFKARMIILVFSSHDYFDFMTFQNVVGNTDFYPSEQPLCAITDALNWIGSRILSTTDWNSLGHSRTVTHQTDQINPGWQQFIDYTTRENIPLLVYHHAEMAELDAGHYNNQGQALASFLQSGKVTYIPDLTPALSKSFYHDNLHFNPEGQKYMAAILAPYLEGFLKKSK